MLSNSTDARFMVIFVEAGLEGDRSHHDRDGVGAVLVRRSGVGGDDDEVAKPADLGFQLDLLPPRP